MKEGSARSSALPGVNRAPLRIGDAPEGHGSAGVRQLVSDASPIAVASPEAATRRAAGG
jgi:hypothetical protein